MKRKFLYIGNENSSVLDASQAVVDYANFYDTTLEKRLKEGDYDIVIYNLNGGGSFKNALEIMKNVKNLPRILIGNIDDEDSRRIRGYCDRIIINNKKELIQAIKELLG